MEARWGVVGCVLGVGRGGGGGGRGEWGIADEFV